MRPAAGCQVLGLPEHKELHPCLGFPIRWVGHTTHRTVTGSGCARVLQPPSHCRGSRMLCSPPSAEHLPWLVGPTHAADPPEVSAHPGSPCFVPSGAGGPSAELPEPSEVSLQGHLAGSSVPTPASDCEHLQAGPWGLRLWIPSTWKVPEGTGLVPNERKCEVRMRRHQDAGKPWWRNAQVGKGALLSGCRAVRAGAAWHFLPEQCCRPSSHIILTFPSRRGRLLSWKNKSTQRCVGVHPPRQPPETIQGSPVSSCSPSRVRLAFLSPGPDPALTFQVCKGRKTKR